MKTFALGTVIKNAKTGRFESLKNLATKAEELKVKILSALYGVDDNRIEIVAIQGKKLNNKMAGSDPAPKVAKNAIVKAEVNGLLVEKTFSEGEVIIF